MLWAREVVAAVTAGADVHVVATSKRYLVAGVTVTATAHIGLWSTGPSTSTTEDILNLLLDCSLRALAWISLGIVHLSFGLNVSVNR
jgi:hypothetical protein